MDSRVRVIEYAFSTPEQRRAMAESLSDELEHGARVVGMVPVSQREDEAGDLTTLRVAVYLEGGEDESTAGEAVAAAAVAEPESETIVEQIMSIPTEENPSDAENQA